MLFGLHFSKCGNVVFNVRKILSANFSEFQNFSQIFRILSNVSTFLSSQKRMSNTNDTSTYEQVYTDKSTLQHPSKCSRKYTRHNTIWSPFGPDKEIVAFELSRLRRLTVHCLPHFGRLCTCFATWPFKTYTTLQQSCIQ